MNHNAVASGEDKTFISLTNTNFVHRSCLLEDLNIVYITFVWFYRYGLLNNRTFWCYNNIIKILFCFCLTNE